MATSRTMQPSPFFQRQGKAAKVTRLPVTLSMSPPMFSKPQMPGGQNRVVAGLPLREVLDDRAAGEFLVFLVDARQQPMRRARTMRADGGAERMIERLGIRADHLDFPLHEPLAGFLVEAWRVAVIVLIIAVIFVPAGVDDGDVALANLRARVFKVLSSDDFPFLLRDGNHHAGAEKIRQRHFIHERRTRHDVRGRIDMGARMHDRCDPLRQHAGFRHAVQTLDLHIFKVRPAGLPQAPGVREVVKLEPHLVLEVRFLKLAQVRIAPITFFPARHARSSSQLRRRRPRPFWSRRPGQKPNAAFLI